MENIKYKISLLLKENGHIQKSYIVYHVMKFGYVMLHLKKKFKNKKQVQATKKWCKNHKEKYNEIKKGISKRYYENHPEYREQKSKSYYYKKECKRLLCILL